MERRKGGADPTAVALTSSSPLPSDYLKMVVEVFTSNFDAGLQALAPLMKGKPSFEAGGAVFSDEVVLTVTLAEEGQLAATTVYASCDFDPKASAPTIQDLLAACVDAVGAIYGHILSPENPERLEQVASHTLSVMDNVPFHWTEAKVDRYRIYLKLDKANPKLDKQADDWLLKNDPEIRKLAEQNEEETKSLFVTGPKDRRPGGTSHGSGGSIH